MSTAYADQQAALRRILKNGSGCSLFSQYGINKLGQMRDFELMYQSFTRAVPVTSPRLFVENLAKMQDRQDTGALSMTGLVGALANTNLVGRGKPVMATAWRGVPIPVGQAQLDDFAAAEKNLTGLLARQGLQLRGKLYHLTEAEATRRENGLTCGNLLLGVGNQRGWFQTRHVLPKMNDLPDSGGSRLQGFNTHLDQLKTLGSQVSMLAVHPKTLLDFCLYVSQQAGRFMPLKELCPNLQVLAFNGYDPGVQRTELGYVLGGIENLKWVQWSWLPCGLHMAQSDINIRQRLDLMTDGSVFYEFVPEADVFADGRLARNYRRLHAGMLEAGREYLLIVSNQSGLLGISTGLLVKVLQVEPLKLAFKGPATRLHGMGENLREDGVVEAIANINTALQGHGVFVRDAMLGHILSERQPVWALELSRPLPELNDVLLDSIAKRLSGELELRFEGYRLGIRQSGLHMPQVHMLPMGSFAAASVGVPEFTHFDHSADAAEVKKRVASAWQSKMVQVS